MPRARTAPPPSSDVSLTVWPPPAGVSRKLSDLPDGSAAVSRTLERSLPS